MQAAVWMELLARIPERQRNQLVVMTTARVEITVQELVRMDEEYVVIRGRLAGSSDTGRLFFVPFDQIAYVSIQKAVSDQEITEIFGTAPPALAVPAAAVDQPPSEPAAEEPPPPEPEPEPEPVPEAEGLRGVAHLTPTVMPNRTELLERIRQRSKAGKGEPPVSPRRG
jgi:hypothetical protein